MTHPTARPDPADTVIASRYRIVRALGHGSFGHTYLARDASTDRDVALKLLDPRGAPGWKARELFEREAVVLRSLRHHGVPEVHDLVHDQWNGAPAIFLVMEYVEGRSLADIIDEQRPLDPAEVMHLFVELLGVLEHLHGRVPPILHRDIKPANIIVRPDGTPAIVDFGSVRRVFLGADETGSTVAGTYGYMPYEQYMGQASAASDLYALGATFLHLVTGRAPREFMTGEGRIEVPDSLPGDARLRPILARLLRSSPAERFANAREVRQALFAQSVAAVALPPAERGSMLVPAAVDVATLGPAPREIVGPAKAILADASPSMWEFMDSSAKPSDRAGIVDWLVLAFFSAVTAGILPIVFLGIARARRRRVRRFVREGAPAVAEILDIQPVKIAFDEHLSQVSYQFEAGGTMHRDTDQVLPMFANRWRAGDRVHVLCLPARGYDSIIVSTS